MVPDCSPFNGGFSFPTVDVVEFSPDVDVPPGSSLFISPLVGSTLDPPSPSAGGPVSLDGGGSVGSGVIGATKFEKLNALAAIVAIEL